MRIFKFIALAIALFFANFSAFAQPAAMSINQDVSGTYTNTAMVLQGGAFRARFQENGTGTSSGTRNWQFNADSYFNTWGTTAAAGVQTLAGYNTVIAPNTATASGNWQGGPGYNSNGRLPATQANYYYTYNITRGSSYASQRMAVLETSYNPVTISSVTAAAGAYASRTITITTSATPATGENIFVRFSTNGFTSSTIVQATGSGTTWTATIPWQTGAVSYYVYTSNRSKTTIDNDVTSFSTQDIHDLSTLNLNNNGGTNYSWTPATGSIIVTSSTGTAANTPTAYASFTAATTGLFAILNAGTVHTGTVTVLVTASITEAGTTTLNNSTAWTSLGIQPSTAVTLSSAQTVLFSLTGADNVTIDGRIGGTGSTKSLTFSNTSTTGTAFTFSGDASNNTVRYCTIQGVNTSTTSGVIVFSTGTTTGNDNNTIDNCDIRDGATTPNNGIYSSGTTTTTAQNNSGITISNCNIYNFFNATTATNGISVQGGNTDWTITGNSIYQTATRTFTTGANHAGININNSSGNNFVISGNYVGGGAPLCGGTAWTYNGAFTNRYRGISLTVGTTTASSVQGNTVANINGLTTSGATTAPGTIVGIYVSAGSANIGTVTGNTIGGATGTGSITMTLNTNSGGVAYGIAVAGTTINVSNNTIGSITAASSANNVSHGFVGISSQGTTTFTANNNVIGSTTTANSINCSQPSTNATSQTLHGIEVITSATTITIQNNTIANLTNAYAGTGVAANLQTRGIYCAFGAPTITGNTIYNLSTASLNASGTSATAISGISVISGVSAGATVSQNTIHSLSSTGASGAIVIHGIYYNGATTGTNVIARNNIHSLSLASSTISAQMVGLYLGGGNTTVQNNMIRLGINAAGSSITTPYDIQGISDIGSTNNYYFNSVYIGGTGVTTGTTNTFAFTSSVTTNTRAFQNNIFYNARSNSTGTGTHFAIRVGGTAVNPGGLTSNYNVLFANGSGGATGQFNGVTRSTLGDWQAATGNDANSISGNPNFLTPNGTSSTVDLHVNSAGTPIESAGLLIATITDDYDGQTRSGLTPTDIGADAGAFTAVDASAPAITFTALSTPLCAAASAQTLTATITDATGVPTTGSLVPRLYYKVGAAAYTSVAGTLSSGSGTNGTWTFTIPAQSVSAQTTVTYYVIAQDIVSTPNIGSNAGGAVATDVNTVSTHPSSPNSYVINPSLSGNYNVGSGQTFTTLTAAVAAYNTSCLAGPVTFTLTDASYTTSETFPITINSNTDASSTNTLTIKPSLANTSISGSSTSAMIILNGADWVRLDGSISTTTNAVCPLSSASRDLTITNTGTGTSSAVVWLQTVGTTNPATNNIVRNCIIIGGSNTATVAGIGIGSSTISSSSLSTGNINNRIENNNIQKAILGVYTQGASTSNYNTGNVITQNVMTATGTNSIGTFGISAGFENGIQVTGNTIGEISATGDRAGILLGYGTSLANTNTVGNAVINAVVTDNTVYNITGSGTNSAVGIAIAGVSGSTTTITNNIVYSILANPTSPDFSAGIAVGSVTGAIFNVFHNSVSMNGTQPSGTASSATAAAFAATGTGLPTFDIRNNIFSNTQIGNTSSTCKMVAIALGYSSTVGNYSGLTSNYNDLYAAGAGPGAYHVGITGGVGAGTVRTSLLNWQNETGRDANSINVSPGFVSATNLHSTSSSINNAGTPIVSVTTDMDCETRNATTPDIGADEFTIAVDDAGVTALNAGTPCPGSSGSVTATIFNYGAATLTTVDVTWSVDGGATTTQSFTGLSIASGTSSTVTITGVTFSNTVTTHSMTATTSLPNGNADSNTANDAFTNSTINNQLSGTYTVGAAGTFTTIPLALARAASVGLCGPTTFELIDASYTATSTITIGQYSGVSSTNTLTIKPATGVTTAITGAAAVTPLITFDGADYVILDGSNGTTSNSVCPPSAATRNLTLTLNSTSTTGAVVWLQTGTGTNSATNNTVRNCNIVGNSNTTTLFALGSGSSTISTTSLGTSNNGNSFVNNNISKAQYGIYSQGASSASKNSGTTISQNLINSSSTNAVGIGGIWVGFENGITISGNTISEISRSGDCFAISAGYGTSLVSGTTVSNEVTNATISNNIIGNITASGALSAGGILLGAATSGTSLISNNMIYGVSSNATPNDFTAGIVVGGGTGSTTNIYNNTVSMQGTQPTGAASAFSTCLWIPAATAPVLDIRNNVFTNTQAGATGSTTKFAAIATNYTSVTGNYANLTSDDNILYAAGAGPGTYTVGVTAGTNRATLNAWQTETGRDASSFSVLPVFVSASNLHLDPAAVGNLTLNATATSGLTTSDIDCDTRSVTPDIGADEFTSTVSPNDAGVTAIIVPTPLCPGMTTVQATITNYGSAPITSVLVSWSVNGIGQVTATPTVNIPVLGSQTVTLGSFNFPSSSSAFTIAANTSSPNGNTDGNSSNDGYSVGSLFTSLSGTYAVGVGGDFTTLTAAVAAANTVGICGSTVFSLTDATYSTSETFPITINALTGASATNTLTIKPTGNTTITGSSTSALIVLNGADYITIDGSSSSTTNSVCPTVTASRNLTLTNTNTSTSSAVIWLQSLGAGSGATNNKIQNVIAVGNSPTTTLACIGSGSSTISTGTTGADNDNNLFINNLLSKAQIGILSQGASTSNYNTGTKIFLNTTESTATNNIGRIGIYAGFEDAIAIHNNTITNISGSSADAYAISLGATAISVSNPAGNQCINALVDANVITTVRSSASAMGIAVCTTTSAGPNRISNNMISDVLNTAASADYGSSITVGGGTGGTTEVYNNTVYMTGTVTDAAARNYALSIQGTNPIVDIKNNIFVNTVSSTATFTVGVPNGTTCIGLAYNSPFTNLSSNNNAFYVTTGGNVASTSGLTNANPTATLSAWQSTTGVDLASISGVNPVFISSTDLHIDATQTANYAFNAVASNIATITTDIDCDTRVNPYDIGADEFIVPNCSGAIGGTATAAVTQVCGSSGSTTITATGYSPAFTGITYSWEISNDGISSWSATGGTNPASFSTGTITATRYYRLAVTCSVGFVTNYSNVVSLVISPTPTASASSNTPLCVGSNLNLTGTTDIGTTFAWTGPNSFTSTSQNPSINGVTLAAAGTYSFVATSAAGCPSATATTVVVVNTNPIAPTITPSSATICEGGNVALTASISGANFTATQGSGASTSTGVSATSTLGPNPMMNYYGGEKQQMLFTAAELTALGLTSGSQITAIGFTLPSANTTYALQNYVVKMANSSLTNLSASWETSLTTVRTAASYTPVVGLNTLTLTTPFTWNGTSSLVIEVNYSNANTGNATTNTAQFDATSFVSTRFYRVDSQTSAFVDAFVGTPSFTYSSRNKTTFTIATPYTYAWSPTSSLTPSNGIGATVTAAPTTTTPYTVTATNSLGCSSQASATVTVNTRPTGSISGTASMCAGSSTNLTLTVTGTGTISGTLSNGASFSGTAPAITVSVSPGSTLTYTIATLSDANCSANSGDLSGSATVTVNPLVTPSVSIAASPSSTICAGDNVTFTATPVNGGTTPSYQWYIGATPVGTNSATFSTSALTNGNAVSVVMTNNAVCPSSATSTSNSIAMTVNSISAVSVSISADLPSPICSGTSVTFTATPTNGGTTPSYQWYVGATPVGTNSATYTTTTLANGNVVTVQMTSNAVCPAPTTATSNALTYTVTAPPTWYQDADGDGYGSGASIVSCTQPSGYVLSGNLIATSGDCNDAVEDIYPGADEWCNSVDDDCDTSIDEGLPNAFYYLDNDGDGFRSAFTFVLACSQPAGYLPASAAIDCNDSNSAIYPGSLEVCNNGIDDDCDTFIDEGCSIAPINDQQFAALPVNVNTLGTCTGVTGTLLGATASPQALSSCITGQDVWYYFTASSNGASIKCTSTVNNILLELQTEDGVLVDTENMQSVVGNEILNTSSLVPGNTYYVVVRNYNSAQGAGGSFNLCVQRIFASTCDIPATNPSANFDRCGTFKADYTAANQYIFHFGTSITYTTPLSLNAANTIISLQSVAGLTYSTNYTVTVDAVYTLTNGSGATEMLTVPGASSCNIYITPQIDADLRAQDAVPNTRPIGAYISTQQFICDVVNYNWSFLEVTSADVQIAPLPIIVNSVTSTRYMRLNSTNIPGIAQNKYYRVQIQPVFSTGPGLWYTDYQILHITPSGGMVMEDGDVTLDQTLMEKDMRGENFATIYPNPNNGEYCGLNVVNTTEGNTLVKITNSIGQVVYTNQFATGEGIFNTAIVFEQALASGLYMVEITLADKSIITEKMVVGN